MIFSSIFYTNSGGDNNGARNPFHHYVIYALLSHFPIYNDGNSPRNNYYNQYAKIMILFAPTIEHLMSHYYQHNR